jgi:hypothetical protein
MARLYSGPGVVVVGGTVGVAGAVASALVKYGTAAARIPRHPREARDLSDLLDGPPVRDWEFRTRKGGRPR